MSLPSFIYSFTMCVCAQWLSRGLTLCDPMDCSPPGSYVLEFSRQEYWSGLPLPPPGDRLSPESKCISPASSALAGRFFTTAPHGKPIHSTDTFWFSSICQVPFWALETEKWMRLVPLGWIGPYAITINRQIPRCEMYKNLLITFLCLWLFADKCFPKLCYRYAHHINIKVFPISKKYHL